MSGLFLTMICLLLSVLLLTVGSTRGIDREYLVKKRSCSQEDNRALFERCGSDTRCQLNVELGIARNCGAKKRAFDADRGDSEEYSVSAAREQPFPPEVLQRIRFSKRKEWR